MSGGASPAAAEGMEIEAPATGGGAHRTGITFRHAGAFWVGVTLVAAGVLAHLPEFVGARGMHFHMAGMPMSPLMLGGMALILAGLAVIVWPASTRRVGKGGR